MGLLSNIKTLLWIDVQQYVPLPNAPQPATYCVLVPCSCARAQLPARVDDQRHIDDRRHATTIFEIC